MKKVKFGILIIMVMGCLSGCCLSHEWQEATCTRPRTCAKCGETEGEALGHIWQEATCTKPRTCERCGETEGVALGHKWREATCTIASTCEVCGDTQGNPLGHEWQEATCIKPMTCANCGEKVGEVSAHNLNSGGFCRTCGKEFGQQITKNTFEDYFEITYSGKTVSPLTITVKPKSSVYTYGVKDGKPYIEVSIWGTRTGTWRSDMTDLIYDNSLTIYLDDRGYGSATYAWSNIKGKSGYTATQVSASIKDVGIYCYPKK